MLVHLIVVFRGIIMMETIAIFDYAGVFTGPEVERDVAQKCCEVGGISLEEFKEMALGKKKVPESLVKVFAKIIHQGIINGGILSDAVEAARVAKAAGAKVFISSNGLAEAIKEVFGRCGINFFDGIMGREHGSKKRHFEKILEGRRPDKVILVADSPDDFNLYDHRLLKVAVNVSQQKRPEFESRGCNIMITGPLTAEAIEDLI